MRYVVMVLCAVVLLSGCALQEDTDMDTVIIQTNVGEIEVELFTEQAPNTVENFLSYVESDFYSQTVFHRVIEGFMIQGGGFTPEGNQKPTNAPIALEANLENNRSTLAMARTRNPDSATSQFFINVVDNTGLNPGVQGPGYAVFGRVTQGMDIVDTIAGTETTSKYGMQDWPVEDVIIESISRT